MLKVENPQGNSLDTKSKTPIVLIGVLGFVALLFLLQFFGIFKTIDTQRATSEVDIHSPEYQNEKMATRRAEKPSAEVESTINEIAQEMNGPVFSDIRTANTQRGWGLTEDQARYYDILKNRVGTKNTNWLTNARSAFQLYSNVKSVISPDGVPVSQILNDPKQLQTMIQSVNQNFKIPVKETTLFTTVNKPQNISDWALFVYDHTTNPK